MTEIEYVKYIMKSAHDYLDFIHSAKSGDAITGSAQHRTWKNCREHLAVSTVMNLCDSWNKRNGHEEYVSRIRRIANSYYSALGASGPESLHIDSIECRDWQACRMELDPVVAIVMCNTWLAKQTDI